MRGVKEVGGEGERSPPWRVRPRGLPLMRQTWGKLLFMHWPIDAALLRPLIPARLDVETYEGRAWVGVVPFTMWGIRATCAPPVPGLHAFHELNVRTYVRLGDVPGVWFLSLDCPRALAVWGARRFFHLPYFRAQMSLEQRGDKIIYSSRRTQTGAPRADFDATWEIGDALPTTSPGSLDFFLTERYCLYSARGGRLYRCRIFHKPWPLRRAELHALRSNMIESHGLPTPAGEPLLHYAEAVRTRIWPIREI